MKGMRGFKMKYKGFAPKYSLFSEAVFLVWAHIFSTYLVILIKVQCDDICASLSFQLFLASVSDKHIATLTNAT